MKLPAAITAIIYITILKGVSSEQKENIEAVNGWKEGLAISINTTIHKSLYSLAQWLNLRYEKDGMMTALLDFLLRSSNGKHVIILHDASPDFDGIGVWLEEQVGSVSVSQYSQHNDWLQQSLKSQPGVSLRTVLVLCSIPHILDIFTQVRENYLESTSLEWLVVMQEDAKAKILTLIREGTQVGFAVRQNQVTYQLFSTSIGKDNQFILHDAGVWRWKSFSGGEGHISTPILPSLHNLYKNLGGRELTVAVLDNWPFFGVAQANNGSLYPYAGVDVSILRTLSSKLNFTFKLVEPGDGRWGGVLSNGTVTGMVGMVARHEAHLAIDEFTITDVRESVVDYTSPYFLDVTALISQAPKEKDRAFAVLSPFTIKVWLLLIAVTLVMGPVLYTISSFRTWLMNADTTDNLLTYSSIVFRSLLYQDACTLPQDSTLRIGTFTWFFFGFIIYALYRGTLTAELARPSYELPIDSLNDALDAVNTRGFSLVVIPDSSNEFIFKEAESGIHKSLWDVFDPQVGHVNGNAQGMQKVLSGKYVYIETRFGSELHIAKLGKQKFHISKKNFNVQMIGILCNTGSPLKQVFSKLLSYMSGAGLIRKWIEEEKTRVTTFKIDNEKRIIVITLTHLQAAFFILVMGYLLALLSLAVEKCIGLG